MLLSRFSQRCLNKTICVQRVQMFQEGCKQNQTNGHRYRHTCDNSREIFTSKLSIFSSSPSPEREKILNIAEELHQEHFVRIEDYIRSLPNGFRMVSDFFLFFSNGFRVKVPFKNRTS